MAEFVSGLYSYIVEWLPGFLLIVHVNVVSKTVKCVEKTHDIRHGRSRDNEILFAGNKFKRDCYIIIIINKKVRKKQQIKDK